VGADNAPLRPVLGKRGDAGAAAGPATPGAASSSGVAIVAAAQTTGNAPPTAVSWD
jgi:hypothetical protein